MMRTKVGDKIYEYKDKVIESLKISKKLRDEFNIFCKKNNIIKSNLIEDIYRTILSRDIGQDLEITKGYVTINIMKDELRKNPKLYKI